MKRMLKVVGSAALALTVLFGASGCTSSGAIDLQDHNLQTLSPTEKAAAEPQSETPTTKSRLADPGITPGAPDCTMINIGEWCDAANLYYGTFDNMPTATMDIDEKRLMYVATIINLMGDKGASQSEALLSTVVGTVNMASTENQFQCVRNATLWYSLEIGKNQDSAKIVAAAFKKGVPKATAKIMSYGSGIKDVPETAYGVKTLKLDPKKLDSMVFNKIGKKVPTLATAVKAWTDAYAVTFQHAAELNSMEMSTKVVSMYEACAAS